MGSLSPVVERLGCEAEHWPFSRPEVKNKWSLSSIPHVFKAWIQKNLYLKKYSLKLQRMLIWVLSCSMIQHKNLSVPWRSSTFPESEKACKCPAGNKIHAGLSLFSGRRCSVYRDSSSTVVKELCFKSEGRWFYPSWCYWNFSMA